MRDMEDKAKERMKLEAIQEESVQSVPSLKPTEAMLTQTAEMGHRKNPLVPIVLVLLVIGVAVVAWFASAKPAEKKRKAVIVPITVAAAELQTVPLEIHTIGNVTPISSINIKSRIAGHLIAINFKEGDTVEKGQILFKIDPRPLQAAANEARANVLKQEALIKQARAQLAKDRASLAQAVANRSRDMAQQNMWVRQISRYKMLAGQGAVSQESYDQIRSSHDAAAATVTADEAQIENCKAAMTADEASEQNARAQLAAAEAQMDNAKLQLNYTVIAAPISGRTGSLQAFEGNLVKPDDNTLVVVNQVSPIYVAFSVPEQALQEIRSYERSGSLPVSAYSPGHEDKQSHGVLTFSENTVDAQTGTIKLKATFDNKESKLWPGQFVNVNLKLSDQSNILVVPSQAVQDGQQGPFVFVLNPDSTVRVQQIKVARVSGNYSVISEGLQAGDKVVTDGHLQLTAGSKVKLKDKSSQ
jgi:multidrug efflux system membrane fusion protein